MDPLPPTPVSSFEGADDLQITANQADPGALDNIPSTPERTVEPTLVKPKKPLLQRLTIPILLFTVIVLLITIILIAYSNTRRMTPAESTYAAQQIDLKSLNSAKSATTQDLQGKLAVNGQLSIAGSLQVNPDVKPTNPKAGQIYFDKTSKQLGYYDGNRFVYVQGGDTANPVNTTNTTIVNNYGAPEAPPSVLLQGGTPKTAQSGSFNISGTGVMNVGTIHAADINSADITVGNITTGNIGLVNTTRVESGDEGFTVNKFAEVPAGLHMTAGDTTIGPVVTNASFSLFASKVTLGGSGGPMQSVSIYIKSKPRFSATNPGTPLPDNDWSGWVEQPLEIGVYSNDSDNYPSRPDRLLWSTTVQPEDMSDDSWLTVDTTNIPLQPSTSYWVAFRTEANAPGFGVPWVSKFEVTGSNNGVENGECQLDPWASPSWGFYTDTPHISDPFPVFPGNPFYGTPATPCALSNKAKNVTINYTSDPSTGGAGAMFSLTKNGQAAFRNTQDSLNAFKIQDAASGSTVFNVDTYYRRISINKSVPDYTLDINGDVNIASNKPLRFGGRAALIGNSSGTTLSGNTVTLQADTLAVQPADGGTNRLTVNAGGTTVAGAATFSSTTAHTGAASFSSTVGISGAATLNGATTVANTLVNRVASANAFRIQNTLSADLFVANTLNMTISITGSDTTFANLTLNNAHFKSTQTTAPTITAPTNCGTDATATVTAGSTDSAGSFTITTGTDSTSSTCDATITFHRAYGTAPKSIIVVGKGSATAAQRGIYVVSETTTDFDVSFANSVAGANETEYTFSYWVIE